MTWEIKPARDAFSAFAPEWDRLNAEIYRAHPMFDSRFVAPLLKYFGDSSEQLCIHRSSAAVDGALILRPLGFGRWALFLPAQAQAGAVLLRDARLLETIFNALPGFAWTIDLLAIDPDYSPTWAGLRLPRTIMPHVQTMSVAMGGGFESYWQSRPRHLVQNMSRYLRRTEEKLGTPQAEVITDANQMATAVARYGALEMSGWKGNAGTAVSMDNAQGKFYRATLEAFAASGQARVVELHIGGKLTASRLIVCNDTMWLMLKTSYDEAMAAMAPGRQLLFATLQEAFAARQGGSVEFYTDASRDQAEWATSLRPIHHHQIYRSDLPAALHGIAKSIRQLLQRMAPEPTTKIIIKSSPTIQDLSADAIRLLNDAARNNLEFSVEWFENLHQTVFTNDPGVRFLVAESDSHCAAILPVRLTRRKWLRTIESLGNYYTSLYSPILGEKSTAADIVPLLEKAIADQGGAHVMRFSPMDPASPGYEALLTALRSIGWVPFRFFCFGNWYLNVDKPWLEYLKGRKGSLRSTIKRMGKKFAAEGGTLEIVTDPGLVAHAIEAYTHVYARSWKKPEPYPGFIPGHIRKLAGDGHLRLGLARLNGEPIAAQIWTVAGGKARIFKVAYDEAHATHAPGTLLTAHLMEHVTEQDRVAEVDFLIGDDDYKKTWMSDRRERWGIIAFNPRPLVGSALLIRELAGRAIRRVLRKVSPPLTRAA